MYKPGRVEAAAAIAGGKRKRDEQSTPPRDTSSQASSSSAHLAASLNLECFLGQFKKDTLQSMCEDMDIPVSGNKPDLIARIIKANLM